MTEKELNPYVVKPWIEKGTSWGNRREYIVGYQIFYKDRLFYNCRGYNQDESEKMVNKKKTPVNVVYGAE
jgi:hypothetical protein